MKPSLGKWMIDEVANQNRMPCICAMQVWMAYIHYFYEKKTYYALKTSVQGE